MERRRFLTLAGSVLVAAACDSTAPNSLPTTRPLPAIRRPTNALVTRWTSDPYSLGSYSYLATGSTPADRTALRADVGERLFFAGEATSSDAPATAHGALTEGRAAADRISATTARASDLDPTLSSQILVIGAGIAGLGAAHALAEQGHQVTVIEARERTGGRIHTSTIGSLPVDLGASWIHGVDGNPLAELADNAGAERTPTDYDSIVVRDTAGRVVTDDATAAAFELLEESLDDDSAVSVGEAVDATRPRSVDEALLRYVVASEIEHEYGADVGQLALGALDEGEEFGGGDQLVSSGFRQLLTPLLGNYDIRTSSPVARISHGERSVEVTTTTGDTFIADRVLVTVPLGVLKAGSIAFDPPLPAEKSAAIGRLGMGVLEKVVLRFDETFWDDADLLGFVGSQPGRFIEWVNLAGATGQPVLVGFNAGSIGAGLLAGSDTAIVDEAVAALWMMYP